MTNAATAYAPLTAVRLSAANAFAAIALAFGIPIIGLVAMTSAIIEHFY